MPPRDKASIPQDHQESQGGGETAPPSPARTLVDSLPSNPPQINRAVEAEASKESGKGMMSGDDAAAQVTSQVTSKALNKVITANTEVITRCHERLGKLYWEDGELKDSVHHLRATIENWPKKVSNISLLAEAYTKLFKDTEDFAHLEKARDTLGVMLKRMKVTVFSLPQFPQAIFELARVYEVYGSFEGALELYGHVLELFPKYIKYQRVLFRCCIVMLHMSNLDNAPTTDLLTKCVEMIRYILENPDADLSKLDKEEVSEKDGCRAK